MNRSLLIIPAIVAITCVNHSIEPKTVDFEKFTIQLPEDWNTSTQVGYDSFVGQIEINDKEKIAFDLGPYSNPLKVDLSTHAINFTTIDDKKAKVVKPKNFGHGTTGAYFDSLETTKAVKFQISGTSLSAANQKLLLIAIRSLTFKN